jgi:hypothetical protein
MHKGAFPLYIQLMSPEVPHFPSTIQPFSKGASSSPVDAARNSYACPVIICSRQFSLSYFSHWLGHMFPGMHHKCLHTTSYTMPVSFSI